jgi:hypothetical protein
MPLIQSIRSGIAIDFVEYEGLYSTKSIAVT